MRIYNISYILLGFLLLWNLLVYLIYYLDKQKAQKGLWRVSEQTLLLMSLCGGGLGALISAQQFRHKTRKWYFKLVWLVGIFVDGAILYMIWRLR